MIICTSPEETDQVIACIIRLGQILNLLQCFHFSQTRRQIKDFSEKLGSEVKDNVEKISEKAMDFIENTKGTFKKKSRI